MLKALIFKIENTCQLTLTAFFPRTFWHVLKIQDSDWKSGLNMTVVSSLSGEENPIWMTEIIPYRHMQITLNAHLLYLNRVGLAPLTDQFSITLIINQQPSTKNIKTCPKRSMAFLFILFFIVLSDKPSFTLAILSCETRNLNVEKYMAISSNKIELVRQVKIDRISWNWFTESVSRAL